MNTEQVAASGKETKGATADLEKGGVKRFY